MEENGRLCRFIFHRGEIISEEAGSESGSYLSSRYIRGNGVEYLEQDGTVYSFQKDEQGSTVFLLDWEKEIAGLYRAAIGWLVGTVLFEGTVLQPENWQVSAGGCVSRRWTEPVCVLSE